jgi:hypothetical protein
MIKNICTKHCMTYNLLVSTLLKYANKCIEMFSFSQVIFARMQYLFFNIKMKNQKIVQHFMING